MTEVEKEVKLVEQLWGGNIAGLIVASGISLLEVLIKATKDGFK